MKRLVAGIAVATIVISLAVADTVSNLLDDGPGPIPVCNGEQATIVLVAHGTRSEYQQWIEAGVDVQDDPDQAMLGTDGHDVMVALVSTNAGGFISDPAPASAANEPTAGDFMCAQNSGASDVFYASRGQADYIEAGGGSDDIYTGGGSDVVKAGGGVDFIWAFRRAEGDVQIISGGGGQDHIYGGRGPGLVVKGGKPGPGVCPATGPCQPGDHIHPCPADATQQQGTTVQGIEYVGPESAFSPDPFDPCTYQQRDL